MKGRGDPPRLRRASDSPPELVRALELSRRELPTRSQIARLAANLESSLSTNGNEVSRVRGQRPLKALRPALAGAALTFKLLLAAAVAAAGAAAIYRQLHGDGAVEQPAGRVSPVVPTANPATPIRVAPPPAAATVEGVPSTLPEARKPAIARSSDKEQRNSAVRTARPAQSGGAETIGGAAFPDATNAAEAALVERAQRALALDPAGALRIAGEHADRFPNGILAQEREFVAIQALFELGRRADAAARTTRFLGRFPDSAHRRRLDHLLGAPAR